MLEKMEHRYDTMIKYMRKYNELTTQEVCHNHTFSHCYVL